MKVSAKTQVKNFIEDALRRFSIDNQRAIGWQDRATYTYPSCVIILQGETNLTDSWARYAGELGTWTMSITRHGFRLKNPMPTLINENPVKIS